LRRLSGARFRGWPVTLSFGAAFRSLFFGTGYEPKAGKRLAGGVAGALGAGKSRE
jgi:hypothetical protein